jgi:hypothetical protein
MFISISFLIQCKMLRTSGRESPSCREHSGVVVAAVGVAFVGVGVLAVLPPLRSGELPVAREGESAEERSSACLFIRRSIQLGESRR